MCQLMVNTRLLMLIISSMISLTMSGLNAVCHYVLRTLKFPFCEPSFSVLHLELWMLCVNILYIFVMLKLTILQLSFFLSFDYLL